MGTMGTGRMGAVLAAALLVAACTGSDATSTATPGPTPSPTPTTAAPTPTRTGPPTTCPELAADIVDAVQDHVDAFSTTDAAEVPALANQRGPDLASAVGDLRADAEGLGCADDTIAPLLATELDRLTAVGPIQQAVVDTFRADPLGTADPSDPDPVTVEVTTAEELQAALVQVGSGSTIRLTAATYDLDQPLVALRPVTIAGAGTDATTIRSTAEGGALVVATNGDLAVTDLTLEHVGDAPASLVVVNGGGYDLVDLVLRGAVADADGAGGFGVILRPRRTALVADGTVERIEGVSIESSGGGGVVVGADTAPELVDVEVVGDGEATGCGLCWIDDGAGTATGGRVEGHAVGVRVDGAASPTVDGVVLVDNMVGVAVTADGSPTITNVEASGGATGIELAGSGAPTVRDNRVLDAVDVGIRVSGTSTARLSGNLVRGETGAGLAVVEQAAPTIDGDEVDTGGEVAVIWGGTAAGRATGLTVATARIGLQVSEDASPTLDRAVARDVGEAAFIATGAAGGTLTDLDCADDDTGVVVLAEDSTTEVDAPDCLVLEQRGEVSPAPSEAD